jgi:hypothetical protein
MKRLGVEHLTFSARWRAARPRTVPTLTCFFNYEKGKHGLFELMDVPYPSGRG